MDVREKLVELLTEFYGCAPMYYDVDALTIADYLISNGVTVQECIVLYVIKRFRKKTMRGAIEKTNCAPTIVRIVAQR